MCCVAWSGAVCFDTSSASFSIGSCLFCLFTPEIFHNVLQRLSHYQIHPPGIKEHGRADVAFFFFMRLHFSSLFRTLTFCIFPLHFWNTLRGVHEAIVIVQ